MWIKIKINHFRCRILGESAGLITPRFGYEDNHKSNVHDGYTDNDHDVVDGVEEDVVLQIENIKCILQ